MYRLVKKKVIQISPHSLSNLFPNYSISKETKLLPYEGGWHAQLAREMLKVTDEYDFECWGMEKKLKQPVSFEKDGIVFRIFPSIHIKYFGEISIGMLKELKRTVKSNDIIHIHGTYYYTTYFTPLILRDNPIIVQHHGEMSCRSTYKQRLTTSKWKAVANLALYFVNLQWLFERISFRRVDRIMVINDEAYKYFSHIVDKHIVKKLTMGVDFDLFKNTDRQESRKVLGWDHDKKYVLFVGAFVSLKGINYLVSAFKKVLEKCPNSTLVLIGEGYYKDAVREQINDLKIGQSVIELSWIEKSKLPIYYSAADVCVMPSLSEGLGMVGIESLACGTPLIGTKVGGIPEIIKNFNAGIIVPPADPDAIAAAIGTVLDNKEKFNIDRENGKRQYSWESVVKANLDLYRAI